MYYHKALNFYGSLYFANFEPLDVFDYNCSLALILQDFLDFAAYIHLHVLYTNFFLCNQSVAPFTTLFQRKFLNMFLPSNGKMVLFYFFKSIEHHPGSNHDT